MLETGVMSKVIKPVLKLITVQQDANYSVYYISVGSSTCFGCWHPSSGARTTVITASGIDCLQWIKYAAINTNIQGVPKNVHTF